MNLNIFLFLFCWFMCRVRVQAWAQARERPVCHHHARTPHTEVAAEGRREDATLLPIQRAAGLLGAELAGAKLLPESAEVVAEFALLLLVDDGIVAVCRSHTSPHARDLPICHNSHTRGCLTAWSRLCATTPQARRVRVPPKSYNPHSVHKTLPKHADAAAHARAQSATRWGVRATQRLVGAARRPPRPQRTEIPEPLKLGPGVPTRTRLSFLFLLDQSISLDTISAGPPRGGGNITICATSPTALAAAQVVLPQPWVSHQVHGSGLGELAASACDGLATWSHHAESLFTNHCVNGAAAHPLCVGAARDHPAFAIGASVGCCGIRIQARCTCRQGVRALCLWRKLNNTTSTWPRANS